MPTKRPAVFPRHRASVSTLALLALAAATAVGLRGAQTRDSFRDEALAALKKAATFYRTHAASHGGYVYYYSVDLKRRWGEGVGSVDQIWVEPPGTPAVGLAYLKAFQATGDRYYLDAATDAARALIHGQLQSGGWTQTIDFDPQGSRVALYRNGKGSGRNHSSLDDNQTQSAIQFLARLDQAVEFKDHAIHEAAQFALDALLKAQFPIGAFPQGWNEPVAAHPVVRASYAETWPRLWPNQNYWDYYTLNDGLTGTVSDTLLTALEVYKDDRCRAALTRLGDFLILAQMPDPQPAWAQQYGYDMHPIWARKFEPPAISGLESEDAIRTLMKVYRLTGDRKYLEPVPRALAYLRTCRLPDGRMARYYELKTNRPLYMNRPPGVSGSSSAPGYYLLTYDDTQLPSHYGWKQPTAIDALAKELEHLQTNQPRPTTVSPRFTDQGKLVSVPLSGQSPPATASPTELEKRARQIVHDLDDQGRWITTHAGKGLIGQPKFAKGFRYIGSNVFNRNVEILSDYLTAARLQ